MNGLTLNGICPGNFFDTMRVNQYPPVQIKKAFSDKAAARKLTSTDVTGACRLHAIIMWLCERNRIRIMGKLVHHTMSLHLSEQF